MSVSAGADFSHGDFGEPVDSDILYVPYAMSYTLDDFALTPWPQDLFEVRVTIPYLRIRGDGSVVGGLEPVAIDRRDAHRKKETEDGLGDVVVGLSYALLPELGSPWPSLEINTLIKTPTASTRKELGTGELDVELGFTLARSFGRVTPFIGGAYRFVGDPPGPKVDLHDILHGSVGLSVLAREWLALGLLYDWRQAMADGTRDAHELVGSASFLYSDYRLGPYAVVGLSDGSPDIGGGIQLSIDFGRIFGTRD